MPIIPKNAPGKDYIEQLENEIARLQKKVIEAYKAGHDAAFTIAADRASYAAMRDADG
jgi:hypothetical protein